MKRVLHVLDERLDPAAPGPLAVAFSGGSDSLALLLMAKAWADKAGRPVLALTVDHDLQPESAAWTASAADVAARLGVAFRALRWTGPKPAAGVPAAARAARHRLLADAARAAGAGAVLLGHTFDDQLENALMRGAGERVGVLRPWSPSPVWPQGRGVFLLRPLLTERRADLQAWLAGLGWAWIDDPANANPQSPRVQARARLAAGEAAGFHAIDDLPALAALAAACRVLPWGGVTMARTVMAQDAALRLLQIAVACAGGREALPRPERAAPLLARLRTGETFTATLGGARIEAAHDILIVREPGEFARAAARPAALEQGAPRVWDGRFELNTDRSGLVVHALQGHAARLDPVEKAWLGQIPAAGRGALPAVHGADLAVHCPVLGTPCSGIVRGVSLVQARFAAACGRVQHEGESSFRPLMADSRQPSYVSPRTKGLSE